MNEDVTIGHKPANILIVDDTAANLQVLTGMLDDRGYLTRPVTSGKMALQAAQNDPPDLVLLDIIMPGMNGYEVCERLKADAKLKDIPVIFISALDETMDKVKAFSGGGVDYVTKPFQFEEVRARVETHLKLRRFQLAIENQNRRLQDLVQALRESHEVVAAQLVRAAEYVVSLIPPPVRTGAIQTDWRLIPCTELGGDSLGCDWIDESHFAMYLLDVSGHGIGPALLSVSILNTLRTQSLPKTDFQMPEQVLAALNAAFPMEKQDGMYFSLWYGVFDAAKSELRYAAGGHPPALFIASSGRRINLESQGQPLGCTSDAEYTASSLRIQPPARLYILSDGCYEVKGSDGAIKSSLTIAEDILNTPPAGQSELDGLYSHALRVHGKGVLDDDFSLLRVSFL